MTREQLQEFWASRLGCCWPLGINPSMDKHAASWDLSHWSCISSDTNQHWLRVDGKYCRASFDCPAGYMGDLQRFDRACPLPEKTQRPVALTEETKDAARWRYFADSPQMALMLGTELDPDDSSVDWLAECNRLADQRITAHINRQLEVK